MKLSWLLLRGIAGFNSPRCFGLSCIAKLHNQSLVFSEVSLRIWLSQPCFCIDCMKPCVLQLALCYSVWSCFSRIARRYTVGAQYAGFMSVLSDQNFIDTTSRDRTSPSPSSRNPPKSNPPQVLKYAWRPEICLEA